MRCLDDRAFMAPHLPDIMVAWSAERSARKSYDFLSNASYCGKVNSTKGRITSNIARGIAASCRQWRGRACQGTSIYDVRKNSFTFWTPPLQLVQLVSIISQFRQLLPSPSVRISFVNGPRAARRQAEVVSVPFSLPLPQSSSLAQRGRPLRRFPTEEGGGRVTAPSSQILLLLWT